MDSILFINACVRPGSRTLELAQHVLSKLNGHIEEVRLYDEPIPPLDLDGMQRRETAVRENDLTAPVLRHARQFAAADTIVVAAPYWDLLFPAVVRAYFEAVTVTGITFRYTPEGFPAGLCKAKQLIYVTTAGGPIGAYNLGYDYVKALSQLYYGIPEVSCFTAEFLDIIGADVPAIMEAAKQAVDEAFV
jgi:FMN-dependent NADH-azoreductase